MEVEHDRPETYPVYYEQATIALRGEADPVVLGLKTTGLDVHCPDRQVLHYDLEGRLLRVAQPNVQWRRGLSGRTICLRRRPRHEGGGLARHHVQQVEIEQMIEAAHRRMQEVRANATGDSSPALWESVTRAAQFDVAAARRDLERFRAVYHDIPILPPDQYSSLVLLASDGCRYNKCTFCGFYRDTRYRLRPLDEFRAHVDSAVSYHGRGLTLRRGIFLGQANALLGPRSWREAMVRCVNERFEFPAPHEPRHQPPWWQGSERRFSGIASFLDAFVGAGMTADEFSTLRGLNLTQVFIGLESGSPELLEWLRKPARPDLMLDTVRAAQEGGVCCGLIVLLGAGGEQYFDVHVAETVSLIRAMQLQAGDMVYLSPLVDAPATEYAERARAAEIEPLSPERLAQQQRLIRDGVMAGLARSSPYVAHYEVEHFVY